MVLIHKWEGTVKDTRRILKTSKLQTSLEQGKTRQEPENIVVAGHTEHQGGGEKLVKGLLVSSYLPPPISKFL